MNDPRLNACDEAQWIAANGFDFLDLTIEGPGASLERLDVATLKTILDDTGLGIIGHTAWYLPFAAPEARIRQAAIECVAATFEAFATLGAPWVNVHTNTKKMSMFDYQDILRWNGESFAALAERAVPYGLRIMVEHTPSPDIRIEELRVIMDADQRLGFHLDVGHAYVGRDKFDDLLKAFGARLAHVHFSDNRRRDDDHLPMGAGSINWQYVIQQIKALGYDDTITLEVFTPDRDYVLLSSRKVRQWWGA
jgi:sugar phosphate isomerase/epimerase